MNATERRNEIRRILQQANEPVSATALAAQLGVSRQIIVGDVALLRAGGAEILATPRGYTCLRQTPGLVRRIACRHSAQAMAQELYTIVSLGCSVLDVIVEHPIYGQLTGPLQLSTRADVTAFLARCARCEAQPLSTLTEGVHLHTLACPNADVFQQVCDALQTLGVLFTQ